MDVLIKGMEKPRYCYEEKDHYIIKPCPFLQTCYKEWKVYINAINVHSDACPLEELPPHGRLVDADKLRSETNYLICTDCEIESCEDCDVEWCKNIIENAPTVLEAST